MMASVKMESKEIFSAYVQSRPHPYLQHEKLQHELENVTRQLTSMPRTRKSSEESEFEQQLLDKRIIIQLKLKRWKEVVEEGYKILGKKGPSIIVYKCILVGLCRLGRYDDEVSSLLEVWCKATPKCGQMLQCKEKMNYYLNAIKSGLDPVELFKNLEDALGLNAEWMVHSENENKSENGNDLSFPNIIDKTNWKFRPPPLNDAPYYLCPRGASCMYEQACIAAHSKEELEEWLQRKGISVGINNHNQNHTEEKLKMETPKPTVEESHLSDLSDAVKLLKELPSFAFHYLVDINRRIKEAEEGESVFADNVPNVKFVCKTPLNIVKIIPVSDLATSSFSTTWTFVVSTRAPMRNVCLLEDAHRGCFRISAGKFVDADKKCLNLVELHDMNALQDSKTGVQVLNSFIPLPLLYQIAGNWPDWFFYKIEVTFNQPPLKYGKFYQSVLFDMKFDPKLIKHLSVEVVPEYNATLNTKYTPYLENNIGRSESNVSTVYHRDNADIGSAVGNIDTMINNKSSMNIGLGYNSNRSNGGYGDIFVEDIQSYRIQQFNLQQQKSALTSEFSAMIQPILNGKISNDPRVNAVDCPDEFSKRTGFGVIGQNNGFVKAIGSQPKLQPHRAYDIQISRPQLRNSFDAFNQDLNPSKFIVGSNLQAGKMNISNGHKTIADTEMTSLYQQDIQMSSINNSFQGSTVSLRSDSPSSICTVSSSGSSNGEPPSAKWNPGEFPTLSNGNKKDSEWKKVQKSNKKRYVTDTETEQLVEDKPPSSGLPMETKIGFLQEMGFDKRSAIKALQFCDKDLERSVEWLLSGSGEDKNDVRKKHGN